MGKRRIIIVGGGAAGFFAAIAAAESNPAAEITLFEATAHPLAKVRVSGGGRCNVTNGCQEPRELVKNYPRGGRELLGPLTRFGSRETVAWFAARGVELKTEADGRMFPVTDNSATIVACLMDAAQKAGVNLVTSMGVRKVEHVAREGAPPNFWLTLTDGTGVRCDQLLLATGGNKSSIGLTIAESLGHTIEPPVPSLFTFHCDDARLVGLSGVSVENAAVAVRGTKLRSAGPLLVTHWGLSGPAILKLSAWGARELHATDYKFALALNWVAPRSLEQTRAALAAERTTHAKRQVATTNSFGLPARLWERLLAAAGFAPQAQWAGVGNPALGALAAQLAAGEFVVVGKSMNKEEFVTCGGVRLREVDFGGSGAGGV